MKKQRTLDCGGDTMNILTRRSMLTQRMVVASVTNDDCVLVTSSNGSSCRESSALGYVCVQNRRRHVRMSLGLKTTELPEIALASIKAKTRPFDVHGRCQPFHMCRFDRQPAPSSSSKLLAREDLHLRRHCLGNALTSPSSSPASQYHLTSTLSSNSPISVSSSSDTICIG
ncbi:hypothetical protein BASA60_007339 [Batrachochytrium salamandrivorans]|nr:hypothetical protein BASA60_007339 [Batrachochytrium salamandrivorans]